MLINQKLFYRQVILGTNTHEVVGIFLCFPICINKLGTL